MSNCPECPEEGLPEWIMSYADMITILMAFFVVMYSMAGSPEKEKEEAVMRSLQARFGPQWLSHMVSIGPGPYVQSGSPLSKLDSAGGEKKKGEKKTGGAKERLRKSENRQSASLRPGDQPSVGGTIFFEDSSAVITDEQAQNLRGAVEEIAGKALRIEVRGHSSRRQPDSHETKLRDNWDLAYERARNTMQTLVKMGIDPQRIRLAVAADNEPLNNASDEKVRGRCARVEIFMLNELIDSAAAARNHPG